MEKMMIKWALAVFSLALACGPAEARFSLTPINQWFKSACHPENINFYKTYICDATGHIRCLPGWTGEHVLCQTPICTKNNKDCVHGNCTTPNVCSCEIGWTGEFCDTCLPLPGCVNGYCNNSLECNCLPGWTGMFCDKAVCSGCVHGECTAPGVCSCHVGWSGPNCTICQERDGCKYGRCVDFPFQCKCFDQFSGPYCDKPQCREGCHPVNGYCSTPNTCWCKPGWRGPNCTECVPYWNCQNGFCQKPWECKCNAGFFGPDCNVTANTNGTWGTWGSWTSCSATCGSGVQTRTRSCNNPAPSGNGVYCSVDGSPASQTTSCRLTDCLTAGNWGQWSAAGPCSVTCGGGTRNRTRLCNNPAPSGGGLPCPGSSSDSQTCNTNSCAINGGYSQWTVFSPCTVACVDEVGSRVRRRFCNNPLPQNGGLDCRSLGTDREEIPCNGTNPRQTNDPTSVCFTIFG